MADPTKLDFLTLTQGEFDAPTSERVQRGLATPADKPSPGTMQLGAINKISQARIRWALAELTGLQLEKVSAWFDSLAAESPKAALETLIELLKFTTPQQKSVTVESAQTGGENFGAMSLRQLQGYVMNGASDDKTVSTQ